ncbi:hypothetical protein I552_4050 [Mycobacterium xenopi 3993]|nr:hypothetical protein I552_4050 [Mycobacterium xenopi 3993]
MTVVHFSADSNRVARAIAGEPGSIVLGPSTLDDADDDDVTTVIAAIVARIVVPMICWAWL